MNRFRSYPSDTEVEIPDPSLSRLAWEPSRKKQSSFYYQGNKCTLYLFSFPGVCQLQLFYPHGNDLPHFFSRKPNLFLLVKATRTYFQPACVRRRRWAVWRASGNLQEKLWIITRESLQVYLKAIVPGVRVEKHLLLRQRAAFWSLLWCWGVDAVGSSRSHPRCALPHSQHIPASLRAYFEPLSFTPQATNGASENCFSALFSAQLKTAKRLNSVPPKVLRRLHVLTHPAPLLWFRYQQRWILNQEELTAF